MKYTSFLAATIAIAAVGLIDAAAPTSNNAIMTPKEALTAVEAITSPTGVKFTGAVEEIKLPASSTTKEGDNKEQWIGGGLGFGGLGFGGLGGWGGFGGFGPYRFGFNCGGIGGWAYPLGYWNTIGAGLYGGGCGLGVPFGGLYYC